MAEEVLICPFCGAPYGETIPAGVVQVKCHYCGARILVPAGLGGNVQRCPSHPETLAVGLCNDCGNSFCDKCLYVRNIDHGRLNLCSNCYKSHSGMNVAGLVVAIVLSTIMLMTFFIVVSNPVSSSDGSPFRVLVLGAIMLGLSLTLFVKAKGQKPLSVHDFRIRQGSAVFLKKCVNCGKEIPIASEQCGYCEAVQPEYSG